MTNHGTYGGAQAHRKRGERPCDDCRAAAAEYIREYRKSRPQRSRNAKRAEAARRRALTVLAKRHPVEYIELHRAELRRLAGERA